MKSVSDEFDVFDASAQRFVDVANVLASNAQLTDLLDVLQRERDQLDLLLDVTNAVVTQLDTRDLFRAVAPALRRCCSADVAALEPVRSGGGRVASPRLRRARGLLARLGCADGHGEHARRIRHRATSSRRASRGLFRVGSRRLSLKAPSSGRAASARPARCRLRPRTALSAPSISERSARMRSRREQFPLLTRVAGQIAIAVRNAFSYERIEELNAQLAREKLYLEDEIRSDYQFEEIIGGSKALDRVLQRDPDRGADRFHRAHHRRNRVGQGARRPRDPPAEHAPRARVRETELRRDPDGAPRERAVRPREGRLHRCDQSARIGRFELADRGTVFLDEVGEIPLELQPKLLRVLQEREFERLGSTRTLRTDARLIAATNRDLAALADEQKFRQDLFYRLNVFPVTVPPLRDRREDIPMLVRHFAQQFARRMKKTIETIPTETMEALTRYDWPGNIRELQNLIERAVILSAGQTLEVPVAALGARQLPAANREGGETLEEAGRRHIITALERSNWVLAGPNGAAARLGIKRSTLQFRMRKLGIVRPRRN